MLYKAYSRKAHFMDLYQKLEYFETLELYGESRQEFDKKTMFFAKYIIYLVTLGQLGFVLCYIALTIYINYWYPNMYMVISTMLWLPSHLIALRTIGTLMLTAFYYVFIISLYLKLRFRQIYNSLKNFNGQGIYEIFES